ESYRRLPDLLDARRRIGADCRDTRQQRSEQSFVVAAVAVIGLARRCETQFVVRKGGVMVTRGSKLIAMSLVISTALIAGCAKRPATTAASAPAQIGTAATTGSTGGATQVTPPAPTAAPQAPATTARPSPT